MVDKLKIKYVKKPLTRRTKRRLKKLFILIVILLILCTLFVFIGLPLIFKDSIQLQRILMFTHFGLPHDQSNFIRSQLRAGLKNVYITVKDYYSNSLVSLGVWHMLPYSMMNASIVNQSIHFDNVLRNKSIDILLYFHGTGESRSDSLRKYRVFQKFFQVIAFDYRSYADSSSATLSEDAVISDCLQLYDWLLAKTEAPIYFWGHSLGSALSARTAAVIKTQNITQPMGLVLESAFTTMREELPLHPYGKIFSWLPYFNITILDPLERNGFLFETIESIKNLTYPIMLLNAEDDDIVPVELGLKLCDAARNRTDAGVTYCYQFPYSFGYKHNFIYKNNLLPLFIKYFIYQSRLSHNSTNLN